VTRVGVNLLWLVPGVVGGSEEYLVRSLLALAAAGPVDLDVTVFGLDGLADAHSDLAAAFPLVIAPLRGRRKALRVVAESSWLAAEVRRRRLEVVHHGGGVVPLVHPGRTVLTIHDLQPLAFPERFGVLKRRYLALMLPRSARAADVIVTSTAFVRDSVVDRLGADRGRCRIVPPCLPPVLGANPSLAAADAAGARLLADVRRRHGIGERYFLYPAITYVHKDHAVLLEALARLGGPEQGGIELVLTGGAGDAEDAVADRIVRLGLGHRVHRLGRVPRAELDALLAGALAMVFPSRYEGFGLPVLEAMAAGVPVAVADATALGEVVGGAGLRLAPGEPSAWAEAMADLAGQPELRSRLSAAGRAHAADFGPAPTAHALAEAYRAAARAGSARAMKA
jgi:alpha-1,3-rhamnosyl/mannosyltransferase